MTMIWWLIGWLVIAVVVSLVLGAVLRAGSSDNETLARMRKAGL